MRTSRSFERKIHAPPPARLRGDRRRRRTAVAILELERRVTPSTLTTFQFDIPANVANQGVELALFGNVPVTSGPATQMNYLAQTSPGVYAYQSVPTTSGVQLPLITLSSPSTTNTQPVDVSIPLPSDPLQGGVAVMFVGANHGLPILTGGTYTTGYATVPTVSTNPGDVFSLFELTNTESSPGVYSLDVDVSEVDQVGFTYTVASSNGAPYPLAVVGTTPSRQTLFNQFNTAFTTTNTAFLESSTLGRNSAGQQLRLVAPQTILGTLEGTGPNLTSAASQTNGGDGGLTAGTAYYYLLTAISATGESMPSGNLAYAGAISNSTSSVILNWAPYTGITSKGAFVTGSADTTGYNIYRGIGQAPDGSGAHPPALSGFEKIGSVSGAQSTTFTDPGLAPVSPTVAPPSNSYGFDPLSTYFTAAIEAFFNYYRTNTFVLNQSPQSPGAAPTVYMGHTVDFTPDWLPSGSTLKYTALQLVGQSGGEFAGVTLNIYQPLFSTNTNLTPSAAVPYLPPMPSWMSNNPAETPSRMIFGCDAAFATNTTDPDVQTVPNAGNVQKSLGNIENVIVSAFNRGLAGFAPGLQPNQWVNPLQLTQDPVAGSGGSMASNTTYYYEVTSVLPNGSQTVPTREVKVELGAGQNAVTLNWTPLDDTVAASYNIYRGTSPGAEVLIANVPNGTPPVSSYTDTAAAPPANAPPPPWQFYSPSSTSNLYSAFLHQNSTTNPATGVSVNGLVYGFPFDDQGNFSTNIQYPTGQIPTTVTFTLNNFTNPPAVTAVQAPAGATAGTTFAVVVSGRTGAVVDFASSDPTALLPAAYTLLASDHGSHLFDVTLTKAGDRTLTITDPAAGFAQTESIVVQAGAPNHLAFGQADYFAFVDARFPVDVRVLDAFGNLVTGAVGYVALSRPGLRGGVKAVIQDGVAQFDPRLMRPGLFKFAASSPFGTAQDAAIAVSDARRFVVRAARIDRVDQPIGLTIIAQKPKGGRDWNYKGTVDVFVNGSLYGVGVARNGLAEVEVVPTVPGRTVIVVRDSQKSTITGEAVVNVTTPTVRVRLLSARRRGASWFGG